VLPGPSSGGPSCSICPAAQSYPPQARKRLRSVRHGWMTGLDWPFPRAANCPTRRSDRTYFHYLSSFVEAAPRTMGLMRPWKSALLARPVSINLIYKMRLHINHKLTHCFGGASRFLTYTGLRPNSLDADETFIWAQAPCFSCGPLPHKNSRAVHRFHFQP